MEGTESATPDYSIGFGEEILAHQARLKAETSAAYLLPHLEPGLRILDLGCGPGSISVGLAAAVAPGGEMHGIDMDEIPIERARATAKEQECGNAVFHVGDVTALPFEDESFDVAHCHNLLMHVPDTGAVLAEAKRVLKTGGMIACREAIIGSSFMYPDYGVLQETWEVFQDVVETDEGHPQMGKELKAHLSDAGFEDTQLSASFELHSTHADIAVAYTRGTRWFLAPDNVDMAIKYGAATTKLFDRIRDAYEKWKNHPGAVSGIAYGEGIGRKP